VRDGEGDGNGAGVGEGDTGDAEDEMAADAGGRAEHGRVGLGRLRQ
jgi:hypothetical protein